MQNVKNPRQSLILNKIRNTIFYCICQGHISRIAFDDTITVGIAYESQLQQYYICLEEISSKNSNSPGSPYSRLENIG